MQKRFGVTLAAAAVLLLTAHSASASPAEDIIKIKRDVLISKEMSVKDLVVIRGSATVYGTVEGSAVILGGSLYLKDGGRVRGQAFVAGGELVMSPDARVDGKITQIRMPGFLPSLAAILLGGWLITWAVFGAAVLFGLIGLAALIIALAPGHVETAVACMDRSFAVSFLRGVFWTIMIAPVALLLAVSIIGIILIPLQMFVVALAFLAGYVVSAAYIGRKVFACFGKQPPPFADAIAGMVIFYAIGFMPVIGLTVKAVFLMSGFGAVVSTRFGSSTASASAK
jgi:hypothetical protein